MSRSRTVRYLLAASVLIGVSACGTAAADNGDEAAVRQVITRLDSAWNSKDSLGVEKVLAPTYVYFSSKGGITPRDQALGFLVAPHYRLDYADRSEIEVHLFGASAVVSSRWRGRGSWEGKEFVDDQRCSLTLGWNSAGWQVLSEHCTQIES